MIRKLINFFNKARDYDRVLEELEKYKFIVRVAETQIDELESAIVEGEEELLASKTQIKKLLINEEVDVLSVKDWYEERFGKAIWLFPYAGDNVSRDVRHALHVPEDRQYIIDLLADEIVARYQIAFATPTLLVEKVKQYFTVKSNWKYITDKVQFKKSDYWERADKSCETRRGDCDDLAILMHCVIHALLHKFEFQEHYFRIKLTAGWVLGEGGHAFNVWLADDGEWYAVESTYDLEGSFRRTWLKTPIRYNNMYVNFFGYARKDRSFIGNNVNTFEKYKAPE